MFLIHPLFQTTGILLALYVMKLGTARFLKAHFQKKARFNWKGHVRWGITAMLIWLFGIGGGLYIVKANWYGFLVTGFHWKVGLLLIPFILFALGSGIYMDKRKKKRKYLPLIHAVNNTVMLLLALSQIYTGIMAYRTYVLGV